MPPVTLTAEQREAIDRREVSIALSAGAGCGKTHVLTERFLSHLQPATDGGRPAKLGQLIAITFTDAAAREMRSRIRNRCYELLTRTTDQEQAHWLRLLREIDSARISTIHAFCASLLRAHAAPAGLDPTFGVLDQGDADVLQSEVIDDTLRERLAKLDDETLDLAAACGLARLKQQIAALLNRRHGPCFQTWQTATPEEIVARWRDWHAREAFPNALAEIVAEAPIDEIMELLRGAHTQGKNSKFREARAALQELLPRLKDIAITEVELQAVRKNAQVGGICTAKDWPSAEVYGEYRDACKDLRDLIDRHKPQPFDAVCALETARLGLALLRLTDKVVQKYEDRKRDQGKLDFDDLLSRAHALIADPKNAELRGQLADDLCLLLVDEFQDTDQLQADLVEAICGAGFDTGRLFFVGDFKQSIYRFRGAEPKVFRELRAKIKERGRLPLTENFRSQPGILHFVNALFCDAFSRAGDEYEALRASRPLTTGPPSVEFLWTLAPDKNNKRLPGAALEARCKEARAIARRLRALVDPASTEQPVVDRKVGRPRQLQPGDVAILFRALSDVQVYEEALREYGLDYYLVGGHAFYAQQEIYDVLNLLRAVGSTADELSLAGVLRSPFFALEDESLFWLGESAGSLNAGLVADRLPPQLSTAELAKVVAAAATIRHLRAIKDRVPIATLLGQALDRTGYDAVVLTEFLGERKLANLHKLLERARAADHGGTLDLDGFIVQLAQFISQQPKEALAATMPEAADVIRLMTIHHAKGLEFPLVVVPDLDRPPRYSPPPAALHRDLGPLVPATGDDDEKKFATGMSLYAAAERTEELEERKRLLYVACTRAADHLILSSSLAAYDKPTSDWMKLLAERFDLEDGELQARLPDGYETPRVRVITNSITDHKPAGRPRGPDLVKMLEDAQQLATGGGDVPHEVAPIPVDRAARRQFSFSRLTGQLVHAIPHVSAARAGSDEQATSDQRATSDERAGSSPTPAAPTAIDPRGLGTLVHDVLARIDFRDTNAIADWCEHLAPQHVVLNADEASHAACEMIERFAASRHGRQMADAHMLHREVECLLAWPPGHVNGDGAHIRGYIDCLYQDAHGAWQLTDYKTDNIAPADVARAAERYEMQLGVYALAAERALGEPPVELTIHFLRPGTQHVFAWTDAGRRRTIAMVNQAIADLITEKDSRKGAKAQRQ